MYLYLAQKNTLLGDENEDLILHYEERKYKIDLMRDTFSFDGTEMKLLDIIEQKSKGKDYLSATAIGEILEEITEIETNFEKNYKYTRKTLVTNFKSVLDKFGGIEKYTKEGQKEILINKKYAPIAILFMVEASTKDSYLYQVIGEKRRESISYESLTAFYYAVYYFSKKYYGEKDYLSILDTVDRNIEFIFSSRRIQIKQEINTLWEQLLEVSYDARMTVSEDILIYLHKMKLDEVDEAILRYARDRARYKEITREDFDEDLFSRTDDLLIEEMPTQQATLKIEKEEKEKCFYFFKK